MKAILIAVDFSGSSENAVNYTAKLLEKLQPEKLILMHQMMPAVVSDIPMSPPYYAGDTAESSLLQLNEQKAKILAEAGSCDIETIVADEPLVSAISNVVEERAVELIVIGETEKSALERALGGSTTADLLDKHKVPLLMIPQGQQFSEIRNIAFATDLKSGNNYAALGAISSFVASLGAKLLTVNVVSSTDKFDGNEIQLRNVQQHYFAQEAEFIRIHSDDVEAGLKKFISDYNIQLLVLERRHRHFFDKLFHKSVSREFAFHSEIPVLFINEQAYSGQ